MSLYETIFDLCHKKGVTPSKMCDDLGISRSIVAGLRNGRTRGVQLRTAERMARYLDVDPTVLMQAAYADDYKPMMKADIDADDIYLCLQDLRDKPEFRMLFKASQKATPAQLEAVARMLEAMTLHDYTKDTSD